jgi:hypothetical protein
MTTNNPTLFEVDTQSAETISNVGGDQNFYLGGDGRSRARALARAAAALGLATLFGGLAALGLTIVETTQSVLAANSDGGVTEPYTQYLDGNWPIAVSLLAAGVVLTRFGRLFTSR